MTVEDDGRHQGACVWLTGLCNSGKTTLGAALSHSLTVASVRSCFLDGDDLKPIFWSELGPSRADRHQRALRLAFCAALGVRFGAIVIAAIISPYLEDRSAARRFIEPHGAFLEIWLDTPLDLCKSRDRRGYYARAALGLIPSFTGISDIYQPPPDPDLVIIPADDLESQVEKIFTLLRHRGICIP